VKQQSIGLIVAAFFVASCSSPTSTKQVEKKEAAPVEAITGLTGLYRCYGPSRQWAQDIQVLRIQNIFLKSRQAPPGKAFAWQITFVSPSKNRIKNCTYSVVKEEGLFEGVYNPNDEAFSGSSKLAQPFVIQTVKKDTDEIYKVALENSKEYAQKNPNVPISMLLEFSERNPVAAWRVIWGTSVGTSAYSVFVDATNGLYLKKAF
jgi:hypothetical protein